MRVLYLVYWGLREPLGQSLVLPPVKALARQGIEVTLITFEKARDFSDAEAIGSLAKEIGEAGVRWRPLRYHKRPTIPATLFDITHGLIVALTETFRRRADIIHARTFVGGVIGRLLRLVNRVPLVYHNEGFWPDQQVEGGFWPAGSWIYRITKGIEGQLYAAADGLILLSQRSRPVVEAMAAIRARPRPLIVAPSCVDLIRFGCKRQRRGSSPLRLIYIGSLGGRYPVEPLGRLLRALREKDPSARLTILSQSDPEVIREGLLASGAPADAWEGSQVAHKDVPRYLCDADVGVFFLRGGIGAESCSPTKVGEYWASGLPVMSSPGIGDTEDLIRERRVGVVVRDTTDQGLQRSISEVRELLEDPSLAERCRRVAEEEYALERTVVDQVGLYRRLLGPEAQGPFRAST